jgi:hypothetical protein
VLTAVGIFVGPHDPNAGIIFVSIGTSIISSAMVVFLSSRYLTRHRDIQEMFELWGILGIFRTRAAMNPRADLTLKDLKHQLDLMSFGLLAFRHAIGPTIEAKIRDGLRVRILTVSPRSPFVAQRELDEGGVPDQIAHTIDELETWVNKLKAMSPDPSHVQIRFCERGMIQSYYRQDDYVYTGPYLYGKPSQQTISFEFRKGGLGYEYWSAYFESLWSNGLFAKEPPAISVSTQP